jgi:sugar phosphate isomerase/epimerase
MKRSVTLFTGQWADLPFEEICRQAKCFGYDGLEIACWGDHFDVKRALAEDDYVHGRWEILLRHGLTAVALSNHLVGQAICDRGDDRYQAMLPPDVWGDGDPEGVRQRAAQRTIETVRACRKFMDARPEPLPFTPSVVGFTGSSIWHAFYAFPPTTQEWWQRGYEDFARRCLPILAVCEEMDVNFALEVHPTEVAFDLVTCERAIEAVHGHRRFGFNFDPSHLGYQGVDYVRLLREFAARIFHVHVKDAWWGKGDGSVGVFGGYTDWADPRRFWAFRSPGRGDIDFERIICALNDIGYKGPLSVEWEDARMERTHGAAEACAFVRQLDFPPSKIVFDQQFHNANQSC